MFLFDRNSSQVLLLRFLILKQLQKLALALAQN